MRRAVQIASLGLALAAAACGNNTSQAPLPARDAAVRKVVPPPPGEVRAYPPHAIRSDGVGPYLVDASLSEVLHALSEGPRIELLQIGRLADWRIVRAEGGKIVIGAHENRVGFIAVLAPEVARIEGGLEVGATAAQLVAQLGQPAPDDTVRDRAVYRFPTLPGVSFFTDVSPGTPPEQARVTAVLVAKDRPPAAPSREACRSAEGTPPAADIIAAVKPRAIPTLPYPPRLGVTFGCFTTAAASGTPREALVAGVGELWLVALDAPKAADPSKAADPPKPRRLTNLSVPGADFTAGIGHDVAAPFDIDGDGRDEVLLVLHHRGHDDRAIEVRALRLDNGRLVQMLDETPFAIDRDVAEVAGVTPDQIDLSVAVARGEEGEPTATGYYIARKGDIISELVPLRPASLRVPRKGVAAPQIDAGDGGDAPDAGSGAATGVAVGAGSRGAGAHDAGPRGREHK